MKKKITIIAIILLVVIVIGYLCLRPPKETLQIPISVDHIQSISLYYTNEGSKKVIDTQTDIEAILQGVQNARIWGTYIPGRVPAGVQSFTVRFDLDDGTHFSFAYSQSSKAGSGYYSDGTNYYRLVSLDLYTVWESLAFPAVCMNAQEELAGIPTPF